MIKFNKPFIIGHELEYIREAVENGKISGDGIFSKKCQQFLEERYGYKKVLLTTSCTDALEMTSILMDIQPGDEVIVPSFAFVSTANAYVLRGAKIIFADIDPRTFNIEVKDLEKLITKKTKAIVIIHYAGIACKMEEIMALVKKHKIFLVEDAALALNSYYKDKPLGTFGHFATFSFHETKNLISGEGGALVINDKKYFERAEIIREKGTNRTKFFRKEINKYEWIDLGSSFLPSEIIAAFLYAQLENLEKIQKKRVLLWERYYNELISLEQKGKLRLPVIPEGTTVNGQLFYMLCNSAKEREQLTEFLKAKDIIAVFHYLPLHQSPFYKSVHGKRKLPETEKYHKLLLRLPLYYPMEKEEQDFIIKCIFDFYKKN
ncbi:MAG: dTDP-4-amino-4,6-dideoxygalactose transaminase [Cytophagaceae bacterium]|nr:dTDP-4-amino-4,6-dideoxygalactose transaminase [Cytophagaceae bacterium]